MLIQVTQDKGDSSLGWEDPLEKGMETHCSILAWRFPWTGEPVRLWGPWGLKESDTIYWLSLHTHTHTHTHTKQKWTVSTQKRALRLDTRHQVCGVLFGAASIQLHPRKQWLCCWWRWWVICSCSVTHQGCFKITVIHWCLMMGNKGATWEPTMVMPLDQTRDSVHFSSVQFSRSVVSNSAARQASLSITNSWSLLKLMSIESVMPSNHVILCCLLLLPPSIFPSIRVFSNESVLPIKWPKYWSFSFSISPSNKYSGLISFRMDWLISLQSKGLSRVFSNTTVQKHQFSGTQLSLTLTEKWLRG